MLEKTAPIVIIDDTPMVREMLRRVLASLGYENVKQAGNGREALKIIDDMADKVRLIFLDIVMPVMDGRETLKKIREKDKNVVIVMLTSVADKEVYLECKKEGIKDYILKPINAANGPDILSKILNKL